MEIATNELIAGLLSPKAYPWQPASVELIETHVSLVFLAGDRVVKIKRPVAYPFVDFRELETRRQSCQDEVRLNRRLTDGVYLDIVPIIRAGEGLRVGGEGEPLEWATLMRRLPSAGMLDATLRSGSVPAGLGRRLAKRLVPFHRDLSPVCGRGADVVSAATRVVTDNLDELAPFAGTFRGSAQFDLIATAVRGCICNHGALLQARAAEGWIREGHGDLRCEHICLEPPDEVQIFDCVEFNRDLRCADVASDLAFLLMDLTRFGAEDAGAALLVAYRDAAIPLPDVLLRLYWAHRALVRAKVACLKLKNVDTEATALAVKAADYVDLAATAALTARPMLIMMTGLSGTGKSTVARRLSRALGAPLFVSDVVRKELAGAEGAAPAAWQEGIYDPAWTQATYAHLFALAEAQLVRGVPVILDAAFLTTEQRRGAAAAATRCDVPLVVVETVCDEETVATRLAARANEGTSPSDATLATYQRQRAAVTGAPPLVPGGALAVRVDTSGEIPNSLDSVWTALRGAELVLPVTPSSPVYKS